MLQKEYITPITNCIFYLQTAYKKRPMYNRIGVYANPTQRNDGITIHKPVIAVNFCLFKGIFRTYPPCIIAIDNPKTKFSFKLLKY